jgi:hypothetical protein
MLSVVMLGVSLILFIVMPNVVMLSVIILIIIIRNVTGTCEQKMFITQNTILKTFYKIGQWMIKTRIVVLIKFSN